MKISFAGDVAMYFSDRSGLVPFNHQELVYSYASADFVRKTSWLFQIDGIEEYKGFIGSKIPHLKPGKTIRKLIHVN